MAALYDLQGLQRDSLAPGFRSPHHSASAAALVGGGAVPGPGEISLAHGGVLFLDELAEFTRHTLDMLREPLESGEISLVRARCRVRYPARFQLVAAMNPCPCGFAGDTQRDCRCSAQQRQQYAARVSGPLLDRIDLHVRVEREDPVALLERDPAESSARVRRRVVRCRERQLERQGCDNAALPSARLLEICALAKDDRALLTRAARRMHLSSRAVHRCLKTARTIADLQDEASVGSRAIVEALGYRSTLQGLAESADG